MKPLILRWSMASRVRALSESGEALRTAWSSVLVLQGLLLLIGVVVLIPQAKSDEVIDRIVAIVDDEIILEKALLNANLSSVMVFIGNLF